MSEQVSAIVIHLALKGAPAARPNEARLEEAIGLASAINLHIVEASVISVLRPRPATLMGSGKVEDIRAKLDGIEPRPELVIIDGTLTPVQHRNLENAWDAKVLDRTALILEIFGARAKTAEGRLQVDLAHLEYQRSRLVRSWTHLERQRGGAGFLGGPGERQIESDRRALSDKIVRLKNKLEDVRRTRSLQRAKRKRAPHPVVALVGYTNAGKSTLFNRLTQSNVEAKDLLFATLDPTMRTIDMPSGIRIILSDTVGFISGLPTQLVAAFRATLEEVLEADIIVHVRDISHEDTEAQREDVLAVLEKLGLTDEDGRPVIEALNKIDLLDEESHGAIFSVIRAGDIDEVASFAVPQRIAVSAQTGEGVDHLLSQLGTLLTAAYDTINIVIPASDGAARAWLHQRAEIKEEVVRDTELLLVTRLSKKAQGQFFKTFPVAYEDATYSTARQSA